MLRMLATLGLVFLLSEVSFGQSITFSAGYPKTVGKVPPPGVYVDMAGTYEVPPPVSEYDPNDDSLPKHTSHEVRFISVEMIDSNDTIIRQSLKTYRAPLPTAGSWIMSTTLITAAGTYTINVKMEYRKTAIVYGDNNAVTTTQEVKEVTRTARLTIAN